MKRLELSELAAYAENKYHIQETHKWPEFPGFSVLVHPKTGKWVAVLMRQWDERAGATLERCDIKCGRRALSVTAPYLTEPFRMKSQNWIGVKLEMVTTPSDVFERFDEAMQAEDRYSAEIVIPAHSQGGYTDTPIEPHTPQNQPNQAKAYVQQFRPNRKPFADTEIAGPGLPQRIREMFRKHRRANDAIVQRNMNFYIQGKFMEDYEDNQPWDGELNRYFATYHTISVRQLRGYFTWRTQVRRGVYGKIAISLAYMYLYELLCGIGTRGPEDSLQKMKAFETGFLDANLGDAYMRTNLHRWMLGYAVMHNIPAQEARRYADSSITWQDDALLALKEPATHDDEDIVDALVCFSDGKIADSPVMMNDKASGIRLFASVWRTASEKYRYNDEDLFTSCFREPKRYPWAPLSNAVYWEKTKPADTEYELNACRRYRCRSGLWEEQRYDALYFDKKKLNGLLHEADRALRKYLKTGHYLRTKADEAWATPFVEAVIEAEERAKAEAARPKITIDLSGLDRIRKDANITRDSLLTDSEIDAESQTDAQAQAADASNASLADTAVQAPLDFSNSNVSSPLTKVEHASSEHSQHTAPQIQTSAPIAAPATARLDAIHSQILAALLRDEDARSIIRANHLMASIVADTINEAFFDEIGDNILECDGDTLTLVEDYREEVTALA